MKTTSDLLLDFIKMQNFRFQNKIFILICLISFLGCNSGADSYNKTESGLQYKFIHDNEGKSPEIGDLMNMHIMYLTPSDSVLYDSKVFSDSFSVVLVNPTFIGGVEEGFAMMSEGDSAHFKVSADSLFEKTFMGTLPVYLQKGDEISFRVKLQSFIPAIVKDSLDRIADIDSRVEEFRKIDIFLKENNMEVFPTKNGAYLSISKPGIGPYPEKGDSVFVEYTGSLLDGTIFDKSIEANPPFGFKLGERMVIEGFEECIPLLNKGAVARMVLPSDLAYGGETIGMLPGYSTLVFDVKILDIKKNPKIRLPKNYR